MAYIDITRDNGLIRQGNWFEHKALNYLRKQGMKVFRPDYVYQDDEGEYVFVECKYKYKNKFGYAKYTSPEITGHGISAYQYYTYKRLYETKNQITEIHIWDCDDKCWYFQYFHVLLYGKKKYVNGSNGKVMVFDIDNFEVICDE